uniref:Protein NipSnap homolog 3A-like n=1 Tax=Sinocyclocheilus rhinocerous TaxID=307959 RepID=A0A673JAZ2_9TELE
LLTFPSLKVQKKMHSQCCLRLFDPSIFIPNVGYWQQHGTFYEFRTYYIQPHLNAVFLRLTNEEIHLRTAHSELIGYWSVEYKGLTSLWRRNSYAQRVSVWAALAQDPKWIEQYISKAMLMLSSQDNEVTYLVPWSKIQKPPKDGGVLELATFQMKPGGLAVWGRAFQAAVGTHTGSGYAHAVGVFHSEFGQLNQVHVLWWYESADQRAAIRHKSHNNARVVAVVKKSAVYLVSQKNKRMFPCAFSPIK